MKRLLDIWSRYVNQFDTVENWSNSVTYSCSQIKLLKDNIKEFGTDPVISSVRGSAANYKPQDPEFCRKLYKEKAMPFLRLESATPTETEKTIVELKKQIGERDEEIDAMKEGMRILQPLIEMFDDMDPEDLVKYVKTVRDRAIDIPLTDRFNKKLDVLMHRKEEENEDKIYINELLELSREASAEEEAEARNKSQSKKRSL